MSPLEDIEQGVHLAREHGIGAVVSLGGGAVIDAGKAIAALVPASGPVMEYLEGGQRAAIEGLRCRLSLSRPPPVPARRSKMR
jgi:alcohol dehydrogenase class IV